MNEILEIVSHPTVEIGRIQNLPPPSFTFMKSSNSDPAGRLFVNSDGKLEFEGNCEESAKIFFEHLVKWSMIRETEKMRPVVKALKELVAAKEDSEKGAGWDHSRSQRVWREAQEALKKYEANHFT